MKPKINLIKCDKKLKIKVNRSKRKNNFCSECHLQFGNNTVFRLHQKLVHMPEMKYNEKHNYERIIFPCTHCNEQFSTLITYEMHFKFVHCDELVRQQLHKLELQEVVVNSLKLQMSKLKKENSDLKLKLTEIDSLRLEVTTLTHMNDAKALKIRESNNKIRELEDAKVCKICNESEITMLFKPCSHCATCETCSAHASITNCPICRAEIFEKIRIIL